MALQVAELETMVRDVGALQPLVQFLRAACYTSAAIAESLDVGDSPEGLLAKTGLYSFLMAPELAKRASPLGTLALLFLFSSRVHVDAYRGHIPAEIRALLERYGLVSIDEDGVTAAATITEYRSLYFLSDSLFANRDGVLTASREPGHTMPIHASTLALLARLQPGERCLDIGTGCGCLALLCPGATSTIGIDLSHRCVLYATINAALNGKDAEFIVGDCRTFSSDRRFDHVIFNSPSGLPYQQRDGEVTAQGDDIVFELLNRLPELVAPGGRCQALMALSLQSHHTTVADVITERLNIRDCHVEAVVARASKFTIDRRDIAKGKIPDGCYHLDTPSDDVLLLRYLRAQDIKEVLETVLTVQLAPNGGERGSTRLTVRVSDV